MRSVWNRDLYACSAWLDELEDYDQGQELQKTKYQPTPIEYQLGTRRSTNAMEEKTCTTVQAREIFVSQALSTSVWKSRYEGFIGVFLEFPQTSVKRDPPHWNNTARVRSSFETDWARFRRELTRGGKERAKQDLDSLTGLFASGM